MHLAGKGSSSTTTAESVVHPVVLLAPLKRRQDETIPQFTYLAIGKRTCHACRQALVNPSSENLVILCRGTANSTENLRGVTKPAERKRNAHVRALPYLSMAIRRAQLPSSGLAGKSNKDSGVSVHAR